MKLARTDRSLIAWMLYCCVLFNVFACSIGHGQMVGMQLNGIGGQFCTVDPRTQSPAPASSTDESLPTLSKAFGCPLCSSGGMGPALNSSLNVAVMPQPQAPPAGVVASADSPSRFTWPAANPRAPPAFV
ncbi:MULTISPECIES: DUF2946 domain-containing protein [unclassified Pseudomonas]|uniref:DUF2946 domain-containing protein n=1 Tax=unclassified Pseudomonas TaxID=196821 RepID=UPI0011ED2CD3|nr:MULTISPECIES: DUF2946 domain-containing protein [unclassified Pseudomonas]KAA0947730.1 DUF2946 domain-containing protein [Pseudomonas sp. ANT_H4]KAA0952408.1 DUF2946 domain-containing protein [Pseudomonas sp. ANT_H14]